MSAGPQQEPEEVLADKQLGDLLRDARQELTDEDDDSSIVNLLELHRRPTRDVFDAAALLTRSDDRGERTLGVRILRELGEAAESDGRRPFGDETVPLLRRLLADEEDPDLEAEILRALAYNAARVALPDFLARQRHPSRDVRVAVSFQLPYVMRWDPPDLQGLEALEALTADEHATVRFYALYALVKEGWPVDQALQKRVAAARAYDSDTSVRRVARDFLRGLRSNDT